MSPWELLTSRVDVATMDTALAYTAPIADHPVGAGLLRAGIRYEALLRGHQRRYFHAVAITTGLRTRDEKRRVAEQALRRELAPGRAVDGAGVPAVFWHGPDHVSGLRPVVVLLNGWSASGLAWPAGLLDALSGHDVVRIDNRGAGYSRTAPAPFTMARLADDVADVLAAVGAPSATVVGLSMGGMIAQEVALRHPGLVQRLVLCGTRPPAPAGFTPPPASVQRVLTARSPEEPLGEYLTRTWGSVTGDGFADRNPEAMQELIGHIARRPTPQSSMLSQLRAISSWHGPSRLGRIDAETTVIHGVRDPLMPVGNGMRLAQMIPHARYVELAHVGHLVPYEAPDAVTEAILA